MIAPRLAAALVLAAVVTGPARAGTSLVVDAASGAVLSSENANQAWRPASTTKMMTIYLALKAVREGRIGLETAIPASKRAASQPRVKVYIKPGQEVTLDDALRIMMVKSANDIAYVVAEGVGGDVESFVAMMNAEAQRLGMRDTRFANPNGWDHPDQQTSARDLAVLAMALIHDFPQYSDYWGTSAVQLGKQVLHNTNGLVGRYSGVSGMKTGFTCPSGFNVVATASRGGRTLIAVVLGSLSGAERTVKAAQLLDEGFAAWGGAGYSVAAMPPSGTRAPNICDDVRHRGGGVALADDADLAGPISGTAFATSGNDADGGRFATAFSTSAAAPVATRSPRGRVVLGPRAETVPIQVSFGRTPGSASAPLAANVATPPNARVARGTPTIEPGAPVAAGLVGGPVRRTASGNGAIPHGTTAFAPASAPVQPSAEAFEAGPLRLQGAIQSGAAKPASLRPGAAAGIKPAPRSAQPAKVQAAKPQPEKTQPLRTPPARALPAKPKPSQAAAKPQAGKPEAKARPANGA
jgi:D-alanyl-D-alanine carboxypeptidase